jgi:hypothetical protein
MMKMKKMLAAFAASAVAAVSVAAWTFSASALDAVEEAPYTVYMAVSAGNEQQWNPGDMTSTDATVTGDGDYSVSVTFEAGSSTIDYLSLDSNINVYSFVEEGGDPFKDGTAKITIKSIEIQHTDGTTDSISWTDSSTALRTSDNGTCLRYSLLDNWGAGTHENNIDTDLSSASGGIAAGDSLVVNFTVSGINAGGGMAETTAADESASGDTTTTTAAGGNDSTNSDSSNNSNSNSSSNSSNSSKNSISSNSSNSSSSSSNDTTSQTGDFGIAAVVLGAVAAGALGAGAVTAKRKK